MHELTLLNKVVLGDGNDVLPGKYIVDDLMGAQLMAMAGGGRMRPVDAVTESSPTVTKREFMGIPKSRVIMRAGGFGDLCLLTPVLRAHKRQFPNCHLAVATMAHYAPVLFGLPYVDEIVPYPASVETMARFDEWVFLENAIEGNPDADTKHMTDVYAGLCGVTLEDKKPDYRLKPTEAIWANESWPRGVKRRAAIQVSASGKCRIYAKRGVVAAELLARGFEVMLLGAPGDLPKSEKEIPGMINLVNSGLSFRQSVAAMNTCDVVVAPDSALLHIAGALDIPAIGLYGAFHWKQRTTYSPSIEAIQGNGDCSPCRHHANSSIGNHFPAHCPTGAKGFCGVLAEIEPKRVVALAEKNARTVRSELLGVAL